MFEEKKIFEEPDFVVNVFDVVDVLTASGDEDENWGGGESGL